MTRADRQRESGFTLIEALIAMVILAVGLTAIANLFLVAGSSSQVANKQTATATQATEVMERLKAIPFTQLQPVDGITPPPPVCPAPCADSSANDCVVPGAFAMCKQVPGIGQILTRWQIQVADTRPDLTGAPTNAFYFINVQSEIRGPLGGALTQSRFSTMRACTTSGCPGLP